MFEVERKFQIADPADLQRRLSQLGAQPKGTIRQVDHYLVHPARDFAQTDEALRVRESGGEVFVTYKGPKIDTTTKTRREIELPLGNDALARDRWLELWHALGFNERQAVAKTRHRFELVWQGRPFEAVLDEVDEVGTFAELETSATQSELDAARHDLAELVAALELRDEQRQSYLQLLLAKRAARSS